MLHVCTRHSQYSSELAHLLAKDSFYWEGTNYLHCNYFLLRPVISGCKAGNKVRSHIAHDCQQLSCVSSCLVVKIKIKPPPIKFYFILFYFILFYFILFLFFRSDVVNS